MEYLHMRVIAHCIFSHPGIAGRLWPLLNVASSLAAHYTDHNIYLTMDCIDSLLLSSYAV